MIESREVIPASELAKHKAEEEVQEKVFAETVQSEQSHQKTKIFTGKAEGRELWT